MKFVHIGCITEDTLNIKPFKKLSAVLPVSSRHIGFLVGAILVLIEPSYIPAIFRERHRSASLNSNWLRNGSKHRGLGVYLSPLLAYMRVKWNKARLN